MRLNLFKSTEKIAIKTAINKQYREKIILIARSVKY